MCYINKYGDLVNSTNFRKFIMIYGKLEGIALKNLKILEKLEKKKSNAPFVVSLEIARSLCAFSHATGRQAGVLLTRTGEVENVISGTPDGIMIPLLSRFRLTPGRLRGLRLIHTHPAGSGVDDDDMADLSLLRLDSVTSLSYNEDGLPSHLETAYLLPGNNETPFGYLEDRDPYNQKTDYQEFIKALDDETYKKTLSLHSAKHLSYAVLTGTFTRKETANIYLDELSELARSAGLGVAVRMPQIRNSPHPRYLVGPGALKEIVIRALNTGAEYIIFDNELSPSQARAVGDFTELKVIDRTQLILDIFASRAKSGDGKLRVELAQLKYMLPRLTGRDDALSRLTGGIGGRGPGETKLEIDKRRISDRIAFLSGKLKKLEQSRRTQRIKRQKDDIPVISIVGYTNAGKSTLLNSLTNSEVYADNLLFATLDTSSKRIRFPHERDVIITDTVGFIRDLPANLAGAFKSTLEELGEADLFLHVIDASDPHKSKQIKAVENVLSEMGFAEKERIIVFNKIDLLPDGELSEIKNAYPDAVFLSALNRSTFDALLNKIRYHFFKDGIEWEDD